MASDDEAAHAFWDEHHHVAEDPDYWMAHPLCREAINRRVSGDPHVWPLDAFAGFAGRRLGRTLSLGCGLGSLERAARRINLCETIEGVDGSPASLAQARDRARDEGLDGITYTRANLNELSLPRGTYDAVFFHQSLHHVRSVEKLLARVARALAPEGLLYLDEWTGPSRTDWTWPRLTRARALYAELPREWRLWPELRFPIEEDDPSECVRSSAILPTVRRLFHVTAFRPYGGHLVAVLMSQLDRPRIPPAELDARIRQWLAEEDEDLVRAPEQSYYAVLAARPRRGIGAAWAEAANYGVRLGLAARYRIPAAFDAAFRPARTGV